MNEKAKNIIFITILVVLLSSASFGIGRLSALDSSSNIPIKIDYIEEDKEEKLNQTGAVIFSTERLEESEDNSDSIVVGSINSDKYHFPWCSGAQRILEENKVYFSSIEEARNAGYEPAGNCKGLE